jgi:hypothetical protein
VETATPAPRESLRRFCSISSRRLGRWCNNCRPAMPMPGSMVRSDAWESGRKAAQPSNPLSWGRSKAARDPRARCTGRTVGSLVPYLLLRACV